MVCLCHRVGVGNVVLQVASTVNCKECIGIEKAEIPSGYAQVSIHVQQLSIHNHCSTYTELQLYYAKIYFNIHFVVLTT